MSLTMKQTRKKKDPNNRVQDGTYMARIVQILDMGLQPETDWQTQKPILDEAGNAVFKYKVMLTFEFPTERIQVDNDDRPRWQSKEYTMSLHEKAALVAVIKAADPKAKLVGYNLGDIIDKPVMVTVGSTASGNAKITGVVAVPKGMPVPPLENDPKVFDISNPDVEVWDSLPDWIQERIMASPTVEGSPLEELEKAPHNANRKPAKEKASVDSEHEPEDKFDDEDLPF